VRLHPRRIPAPGRALCRLPPPPAAHAPPGYAEDTPLWFAGPPAPQRTPDVVLPPASPDDACAMYDIEVFDPTAPHRPAQLRRP